METDLRDAALRNSRQTDAGGWMTPDSPRMDGERIRC